MSNYRRYLSLVEKFMKQVPGKYLSTSATLNIFKNNLRLATEILVYIDNHLKERMRILDLGCGYGYLTKLFRDVLCFKSAYGVDIDRERLKIAEKLGMITTSLDLEKDQLP